jgi:hypothetical protein
MDCFVAFAPRNDVDTFLIIAGKKARVRAFSQLGFLLPTRISSGGPAPLIAHPANVDDMAALEAQDVIVLLSRRPKSGDVVQSARSFRAGAKQAPANSVLNQRQRLSCLARIGLGCQRTNFRGCGLVLRRRDAQFYLRQDSGSLSELTIGISDNFPQRMLGRFGSLLGQLQTFRCALAHRLSTGFDLSRFILDAVENFSGLINQIDSVSASGGSPGTHKAQYIFVCANGRPSISVSHEKTPASIG